MIAPKEGYIIVDFGDVAVPLRLIDRVVKIHDGLTNENKVGIRMGDVVLTLTNISYNEAIDRWTFAVDKAMH